MLKMALISGMSLKLINMYWVKLEEPKHGMDTENSCGGGGCFGSWFAKDEEACEMPKRRREAASLLEGVTDRVV